MNPDTIWDFFLNKQLATAESLNCRNSMVDEVLILKISKVKWLLKWKSLFGLWYAKAFIPLNYFDGIYKFMIIYRTSAIVILLLVALNRGDYCFTINVYQ